MRRDHVIEKRLARIFGVGRRHIGVVMPPHRRTVAVLMFASLGNMTADAVGHAVLYLSSMFSGGGRIYERAHNGESVESWDGWTVSIWFDAR